MYQGASVSWMPRFVTGTSLAVLKAVSRIPVLLRGRVYDITWLQRELIPGYYSFEHMLKKPLIFDLDDALWLNFNKRQSHFEKICRNADLVICGNSYIENKVSSYDVSTVIIPTPVDTHHYLLNCDDGNSERELVVGWIGTSSNFSYLDTIKDILISSVRAHKNARFLLVSDREYLPLRELGGKYEFVRWSADNEVHQLQRMDIGIMPLKNDQWSLGKCSYKILQYMACGAAVVGSRVGMNSEVVQHGVSGYLVDTSAEWGEALHALLTNETVRRCFALAGRATVERRYSVEANLPKLVAAFRLVLENNK